MVIALIVSGGKGVRMGSSIPKQFLELDGIPVLIRTLMAFDAVEEIDQMVLVLPEKYISYYDSLGYKPVTPLTLVPAGKERQDSVRNGLLKASELDEDSMVLIHDGVRPLVSAEAIRNGIKYAGKYGASACGVHPKDTIKGVDEEGFSTGTLDRNRYFLIQTPQCFRTKEILHGHDEILKQKKPVTDDTMVYEACYGPVYLYEGDYANIKITTEEDLLVAEQILSRK
ncbi:2-C-methyl-D-erythritol 4-phosphate cytidylyltransferase [Proteiniclasticum sp. C24MP]|uniref:2-C-methyl-D-erythritol 4-phosphate cytidylyltransferase n=1 Tax=Proteiniclasticum sp. C24MP TaxID=3374101 RepID=UPI0037550F99